MALTLELEFNKDLIKWQRKIINVYWIIVVISLLAEIVALVIKIKYDPADVKTYLLYTLAIPTAFQVTIVLVNELLEKRYRRPRPYTIILSGILLTAMLIYGNQTMIGVQYIMVMPMIIAVFYSKRRYLSYAYAMLSFTLAILYMVFPLIWHSMDIFDKFAMFFIITGQYVVLIKLLQRVNEMLGKLISISRSERDLLIKNIVMEQLNKKDALTELYNHRTFQEYLGYMLNQCESNKMSLQMAMIDIDNFKSINDTYGHAAGDIVIKRAASILQQSFSSNDIIARYGGEEFAILFPDKTLEEAVNLCEKARIAISQLRHPEIEDRQVTVSIGLSSYSCGMGRSNFFSQADSMLYSAKRNGKNKIEYDAET